MEKIKPICCICKWQRSTIEGQPICGVMFKLCAYVHNNKVCKNTFEKRGEEKEKANG